MIKISSKGVRNFSPSVAHGLARCGFGDRLLSAYFDAPARFQAYLKTWKAEVNQEIRTNARGFLPGRRDVSLPAAFPDIDIFEMYANPLCSGRSAQHSGLAMRDRGNMNLARIAALCEARFDEWGHKSAILKRFRNLLWQGAVMHVLRRAAIEADEKEKSKRLLQRTGTLTIVGPLQPSNAEAVGTPASLIKRYLDPAREDRAAVAFVNRATPAVFPMEVADTDPLIVSITKTRTSVHTDHILEYRVIVNPTQFVRLAAAGIKGKHPEPGAQGASDEPGGSQAVKKKPPAEPEEEMLLWIPASIMRQVHPQLIEAYNTGKTTKVPRKNKGKRRARSEDLTDCDDDGAEGVEQLMSSQLKGPSGPSNVQARTIPQNSIRVDDPGPSKPERRTPVFSTPAPASHQPPAVFRHPPATSVRFPVPLAQSSAPVLPREFFNVGLIEAEEPLHENAFLFTFTDPDDPDYELGDPKDRASDPDEVIEIFEGPHDVRPSASQPVNSTHTHPHPVVMPLTQPQPSTMRRTKPVRSQTASGTPEPPVPEQAPARDAPVSDAWEDDERTRSPTALSRYNHIFDQILGIVPGANKRKARPTKRARALGMADVSEQPCSQRTKKRKSPNVAMVTSTQASLTSPTGTTIPLSQRVVVLPNSTALRTPPRASGSGISHSRPSMHREADIVILDSDDEHQQQPSVFKRARAVPLRWPNSQDTASSQQSRADPDGFLDEVERFVRLS